MLLPQMQVSDISFADGRNVLEGYLAGTRWHDSVRLYFVIRPDAEYLMVSTFVGNSCVRSDFVDFLK